MIIKGECRLLSAIKHLSGKIKTRLLFVFQRGCIIFCFVGISRNTVDKISQSRQFGKCLIKAFQGGSKECTQATVTAQAHSQQREEEVARCFYMNHLDPVLHKYPQWLVWTNKHKGNNDRRVAARTVGSLQSPASAIRGPRQTASSRGKFSAWQELQTASFISQEKEFKGVKSFKK